MWKMSLLKLKVTEANKGKVMIIMNIQGEIPNLCLTENAIRLKFMAFFCPSKPNHFWQFVSTNPVV